MCVLECNNAAPRAYLIRAKQAKLPAKQGGEQIAAPRNVADLMDALRKSIAPVKKPKAAAARRSSPAKKRA
jgi:non-homologous end joining protein Ku